MPSVLVLDGGSSPALAIVRSLGRAGWRVLAPAGTRSARSRYIAQHVEIPDAADDPDGFVAAIGSVRADVVAPCTDASAELIWANEDALRGARVLGGDRTSFELAGDKVRTLEAADAHGFPTPAWVAPGTLEEARAALDRVGLPAVVKPRRSYVRRGSRLLHRRHRFVRSPEELPARFEESGGAASEPPLLQAYVPGRALSVTAVVHRGEVLGRVARETLSFDPIAGGTSVWKRTIAPTEPGVEDATRLLVAVGFEGLGEVEYQVGADGVPRLMEIGARAHGWLTLAIAAGVDLPLIAAQALVGKPPAAQRGYLVGVEMRWPAGEVARLRVALGRRPVLPPGVTRAHVLAKAWPPWRPGMRYDGIDLRDPGPWLPVGLTGRARSPAARR